MAITLRLTAEETEALRARAAAEGRSTQEVARAAVREYIDRQGTSQRVEDALGVMTPRYRDVLDRLGQ